MSGMVERVARAICVNRHIDPDALVHRGPPIMVDGNAYMGAGPAPHAWENFAWDARAAIAALREPTEVMACSGGVAAMFVDDSEGRKVALATWRAMIDAALQAEAVS